MATIEKKGSTKMSAEETDKYIRKLAMENPSMTGTQIIIDKIDKLKKQGDLPVKKKSTGGEFKKTDKKQGRPGMRSKRGGQKIKKGSKKLERIEKPGKMGNPAIVTEYEDARENAMINRNIPTMKTGGICRGAGAAIKGTNFKGVF